MTLSFWYKIIAVSCDNYACKLKVIFHVLVTHSHSTTPLFGWDLMAQGTCTNMYNYKYYYFVVFPILIVVSLTSLLLTPMVLMGQ